MNNVAKCCFLGGKVVYRFDVEGLQNVVVGPGLFLSILLLETIASKECIARRGFVRSFEAEAQFGLKHSFGLKVASRQWFILSRVFVVF